MDASLKVTWQSRDGQLVGNREVLGSVQGSARSLLTAERVALNFMQRMSGIATATHAMVQAVKVAAS